MKTRLGVAVVTFGLLSPQTVLTVPALAERPPNVLGSVESAAEPMPEAAGSGLRGAYWRLPPDSIDNLAPRGGSKDIGLEVIRTQPPHATFIATQIDYTGNDLTPLRHWLGPDSASLAPPDPGHLDDGLIHLSGFLAIREPGRRSFTCSSDDGAMVWIGNHLVIDNDGIHAAPGDGAQGTASFPEAGLYPLEIAWFNSQWISGDGSRGGASILLTSNGAAIPTTDLYPADPAAGVVIPPDAAEPLPQQAGTGFSGRYWQLPVDSIDHLLDRGGAKDIGEWTIQNVKPTARFVSTTGIQYLGDDLTAVGKWLGTDGGTLVPGQAGNLDDGLVSITGKLAVRRPGPVTFRCASDDGAILWIGEQMVIENDGVHAEPGERPEGTANFSAAGLYPFRLSWFNSDWTDGAGGHGGAVLEFTRDGVRIPLADQYPRLIPDPVEQGDCIEFNQPGEGPNPLVRDWAQFEVFDSANQPHAQTRIQPLGNHLGLLVGHRTQIELFRDCPAVEVWMVHMSRPAKVEAYNPAGVLLDTAVMGTTQNVVQKLVLTGGGELITHLRIVAEMDEALLLKICCVPEPVPPEEGDCIEFNQPGEGPNPLVRDWAQFEVFDFKGDPLAQTRVELLGGMVGLHLGWGTRIHLFRDCPAVEVWVAHFSNPVLVEAFDVADNLVASAVTTSVQSVYQKLVLSGASPIRRLTITAEQGEPLLLKICCGSEPIPPEARDCVEFNVLGQWPNPLVEDWVTVQSIYGASGMNPTSTRVVLLGNEAGLDLGAVSMIRLTAACPALALWLLAPDGSQVLIAAADVNGNSLVSTLFTLQNSLQQVVLNGNGVAIARVFIIVLDALTSDEVEAILLKVCCVSGAEPTGLRVRRAEADLVLEWASDGRLQSAPTVLGPWTDVPDAVSPLPTVPMKAARFYRLRPERRDVAVKPAQGVEVMQVSFGTQFPNTRWGRVVADPIVLARSTSTLGGYLNVFTAKGWAIQNLPVPQVDQPPTAKYFDLGSGGDGRRITTAELKVVHSNQPLDQPRAVAANLEFNAFPALTWIWNPAGLGPHVDLIPGDPPPTYSLEDIVLAGTETFARYQPVTNVETALNQCWPMAVANCLQFLENQGVLTVVHNHGLGLKGDNTLVGKLDTSFNRTASARCVGNGVCIQQGVDGKLKYLSDNNLHAGLTLRHQGLGALCEILPAGDYSKHGITSRHDGAALTWEWVRDRFSDGAAVEGLITWGGGGGHAVRVTGYGKTLGRPWIRYSHDASQCADTAGLENVVVELSDPDNDQRLNLDSTNNEFVMFLSTGP